MDAKKFCFGGSAEVSKHHGVFIFAATGRDGSFLWIVLAGTGCWQLFFEVPERERDGSFFSLAGTGW